MTYNPKLRCLYPASRASAARFILLLTTLLSTPALAQYVPQSSVGAANGVAPLDGSARVPRANLPEDMVNLSKLGAKLDGSASDQITVQNIYDNVLPSGSVIQVPHTSLWNGTIIATDPNKIETWIFNGTQPGAYPPPVGDGDLTLSYNNASFYAAKSLINTKKFNYPASFFLWNMDKNFLGPWSGNYQQYSASNSVAVTGPTSTGNTSAIYGKLDSFGQHPSAAYDVTAMLETNRYGQNSTWGFVNQSYDFTGRLPQAFSNWMEEGNIKANGYDWMPWDSKYYNAGVAGGRVGFYLSFMPMDLWNPADPTNEGNWRWFSNKPVHSLDETSSPDTRKGASVVKITAADGNTYTWYCTKGGTTGVTQPHWPEPARFVGKITGDQLEVTSLVAGSLAADSYISAPGFTIPLKIVAQTSGTTGGIGTYTLNNTGGNSKSGGMFAAPQIPDNDVIWSFGNTFDLEVSHAFFFNGDVKAATVFGGNSRIGNAVLDTSGFKLDSKAAAIRLAPDQTIDFTSRASLKDNPDASTINQHTLRYSTWVGKGALAYTAGQKVPFTLDDDGNATFTGHLTAQLATPASSSAPCTAGTQQADANYVYVCVAPNSWKRAALSSF
ncbi:hypothetical protein [Labrys okinawensis]|uniref:hypothetical protein n=1 Tax=Labrys okinawensis TaxID=346911 RepID=UPI0011B2600C|nr:hypothetical protein [Labrys okinawensis]